MAFFSVIIPLYNKANFIEIALKSVLAQTFTDFEILVVEDGSTDDSLDIATSINDPKIRIIRHEKNKGLSASRNTGIQNSTSKYLCFLDADDAWQPEYLAKIYSLIQQFPEARLFATNYAEKYQNQSVLPASSLENFEKDGLVPDFFASNLYQHIYCCCSLCADKEVFETVGLYDENITFGEDVDFNIRANSVFKLAYSKEAPVLVNVFSENQITTSKLSDKRLVNLDKYEEMARKNPSLKKYLDTNRYVLAKFYLLGNDKGNAQKMIDGIAPENLNFTQKTLLRLPIPVLKLIRKIKLLFVKKGIRLTSFGSI
ncbi:glycosyltransferase family 2 protein [Flavobacterium sp. 3HN19-14]|uniref:glycosyltransferase family 2 protein n=1 Tax=Flavobacterium sp. 3HN19-14 TaxID=3448133 RepID=UPI003EE1DDFE